MAAFIGIDLGTTYSVVAYVNADGHPEVISDAAGEALVPSVVSFAGGAPVVGDAAKADQAQGHPEVAAYFKRSMGDPLFLLHLAGRDWTATDLSALVLGHLKRQAEQFLGDTVIQAVVTVPEYFTHPQRLATIRAGELAGLEVLRIISEPTAAALAYGLRPGREAKRVLVYDLGGGTFDVSLVAITADAVEVIAAAGDHQLGGRDWDDRLAAHLQQELLREADVDLLEDDDAHELLVKVEALKRTLSARRTADIQVSAGGHTTRVPVSRQLFEELTRDLLERTARLADQVLDDAGLAWEQVDGVLPVGGSTRMPMVRDWIERMSGRPPMGGAHPDQVVALGAAVQAALTLRQADPGLRLPTTKRVKDVTAHSLGMIAESADRSRYLNSVLILRNTPIPSEQQRPFQFELRGDGGGLLEVFLTQGETEDPAACAYLGRYLVTGFPPRVTGKVVLDIAYRYDENAVVQVSAVERGTGTPLTVRVDAVPHDVPERFLGPPPEMLAREPATVYLAFDLSGSMSGRPLEEAQHAAATFVSQCDLTTTAVGLVGFSDRVEVTQKATRNATKVTKAIRQLEACQTGCGNATDPFDELHGLLRRKRGKRYAIVLADGVWSDQARAVRRAQGCHRDGIEVIAIGFGGADAHFLDRIASSTEQALFTDLNRLADTFGTIARELTERGALQLGTGGRASREG